MPLSLALVVTFAWSHSLSVPSFPCPPSPGQMARTPRSRPDPSGPSPTSAVQACRRGCWAGARPVFLQLPSLLLLPSAQLSPAGKAASVPRGEGAGTALALPLVSGMVVSAQRPPGLVSVGPFVTGAFTSDPSGASANCGQGPRGVRSGWAKEQWRGPCCSWSCYPSCLLPSAARATSSRLHSRDPRSGPPPSCPQSSHPLLWDVPEAMLLASPHSTGRALPGSHPRPTPVCVPKAIWKPPALPSPAPAMLPLQAWECLSSYH